MEGRTKVEKSKRSRNGPSRHAAGNAAQADAGSGSDTAQSSAWLAERRFGDATAAEQRSAGVTVDSGRVGDVHRGKALESKRGQR